MSQRQEILTLGEAQVYAIGILAEYHHGKDSWGNWPKLSAPAYVGSPGSGFTALSVDVCFVHGKH